MTPDAGAFAVRDATLEDLILVASWVRTAEECRLWAGPDVSFPIRPRELAAETGFSAAVNLVLAGEAGTAGFGQVLWHDAGRRAHLARVIVRPDARGRGLGSALVEALLGRAAAAGARVATLNVYAANAAAVRLYETAGFRPVARPSGATTPTGTLFLSRPLAS